MTIKVIIFAGLSMMFFLKFRRELFTFRGHGPWMFAASHGLLLLFIINGKFLFQNPFALRQIFSWALMTMSGGIALFGFYSLKRYGRAVGNWENTTRLVREGVFKYIRHPLYASLMLLSFGMLLKDLSLPAASACILALFFLVAASRAEERENADKFGAEYEQYTLTTKRYFPFMI